MLRKLGTLAGWTSRPSSCTKHSKTDTDRQTQTDRHRQTQTDTDRQAHSTVPGVDP
jgi:hypothetical protein